MRGSHYEDNFNKINSHDLSNFQGAYTLGSIYRFYVKKLKDSELTIHPHFYKLSDNTQIKISNLKEKVFKKLKIEATSATNVPNGEATSLMIEGLLFKKCALSKAHKEMMNASYKGKLLNSYCTRIRDKVEVPRDPDDLKRPVNRVLNGDLNNILTNFFLEQMLRTLPRLQARTNL